MERIIGQYIFSSYMSEQRSIIPITKSYIAVSKLMIVYFYEKVQRSSDDHENVKLLLVS